MLRRSAESALRTSTRRTAPTAWSRGITLALDRPLGGSIARNYVVSDGGGNMTDSGRRRIGLGWWLSKGVGESDWCGVEPFVGNAALTRATVARAPTARVAHGRVARGNAVVGAAQRHALSDPLGVL